MKGIEMVFRGAVFDLDGLLMDSEPVWSWAQRKMFLEMGVELTEAMQWATTGMRLNEALEVWSGYFPGTKMDPAGMRARLVELVGGSLKESGLPKAGAIRAMELCHASGCRMAIASSSPPEIIKTALDRMDAVRPGVRSWFSAILSAENEAHGKPHPAIYLSAAGRLGLPPGECIAFEDSIFGLRSAHAAGMYCVAVPEDHNRGREEYRIADRILASLEEFQAEDLITGSGSSFSIP
jgi:mannitol-1-/sugar-/sorbitol-6-/2-deoxyglucose-6-phosphatase